MEKTVIFWKISFATKNQLGSSITSRVTGKWKQKYMRINTWSFSPELSQLSPLSGLTPVSSPSPMESPVSLADCVPRGWWIECRRGPLNLNLNQLNLSPLSELSSISLKLSPQCTRILKLLIIFCEGGWVFSCGAADRYPGGGWTNSRETHPASGIQLAQFPSKFN